MLAFNGFVANDDIFLFIITRDFKLSSSPSFKPDICHRHRRYYHHRLLLRSSVFIWACRLSWQSSKGPGADKSSSLSHCRYVVDIDDDVTIRVVHGSLFLDPTQPDPAKRWPDPTRERLPTKSLTRPDTRPDPSPICTFFNWIIIN